MFSTRLQWDIRQNRLSQLIAAKRQAGTRVLDLTESNPTRAGLAYPPEIVGAFEDPRVLVYEPAPAGMRAAREAVAAYYSARGHAVGVERILLTASTSEAYAYLFKLLCNPGDQVLVPRPSYPLFEFLANLESVAVGQYPLEYHGGWGIDMDALAAQIADRTRAIVLVNPNNPTGSYVKRAELEALVRLCGDRGIALIGDEVFSDYGLAASPGPWPPTPGPQPPAPGPQPPAPGPQHPDGARVDTLVEVAGCLAFSMSGLSKIAGLPQMKLGWIVASGPETVRNEAMEKLEWIADTYLSVSTPVQCAAARLLRAGEAVQRQIRERTAANLEVARETLAGSAMNILTVEGGWYITLQVPRIQTEEEWVLELLGARDVLVQPGFFFDFASEAFLVVSLLTPPEVFREGLARIVTPSDRGA